MTPTIKRDILESMTSTDGLGIYNRQYERPFSDLNSYASSS